MSIYPLSDRVFMAVDRGNTRLKATVMKGKEILCSEFSAADEPEVLLNLMEKFRVEAVGMLSVGGTDIRMVETLRNAADDAFILLTSRTSLPIERGNYPAAQLGADRIAAAVGAAALFPEEDCVIADAGTAITIDLISKDGIFCGGTISPGLALQFRSLHEFTALLPMINPGEYSLVLSETPGTENAIIRGVVGGVEALLESRRLPGAKFILTGGDAEYLYKRLASKAVFDLGELILEKNLVAHGLQYIYAYNEEES